MIKIFCSPLFLQPRSYAASFVLQIRMLHQLRLLHLQGLKPGVNWAVIKGPKSYAGTKSACQNCTHHDIYITWVRFTLVCVCVLQDSGCSPKTQSVFIWALWALTVSHFSCHTDKTGPVLYQLGPAQRHTHARVDPSRYVRDDLFEIVNYKGKEVFNFTCRWALLNGSMFLSLDIISITRYCGSGCLGWLLCVFSFAKGFTSSSYGWVSLSIL